MSKVISKEEWIEWKSNIVTKLFFDAVNYRREDNKEALAKRAIEGEGISCWYAGYLQALEDVLNTDREEVEQND